MPMSRKLRVALGATTAIGALSLSPAAGAQATTAQSTKATASVRDASPNLSTAATQAFPAEGYYQLKTIVAGSGCLNSTGFATQTDLRPCYLASFWWLHRESAIDSRGGAWVELSADSLTTRCLDAEDDANGSPNINGDHVNSWNCVGSKQQHWYLWPLGNGTWMIVNQFNTNKVLDARTSGGLNATVDGDPVQVWDHVGTPQQAWIIG